VNGSRTEFEFIQRIVEEISNSKSHHLLVFALVSVGLILKEKGPSLIVLSLAGICICVSWFFLREQEKEFTLFTGW
jgi:Na+/glutamate symporter